MTGRAQIMTEGKNIIAVVTGASRGAGKGIALALGEKGCTVYVTGRSQTTDDSPLPGTIFETAAAITAAGGHGIPCLIDHRDDSQVEALFSQIAESHGHIDILVNNAFAAHDQMTTPGKFWEKPLDLVDMWQVGLRGSYVTTYFAAPLLKTGSLVIFTSAPGARHYVFGPTYGVHKAGLDKMAADMAVDFRDLGITSLSIWMGALLTERMSAMKLAEPEKYQYLKPERMESPQFTGHLVWELHKDPEVMALSGKTLIGAELAHRYGLTDRDGIQPPSYRDQYGVAPVDQHPFEIH